MSAWEVHVKLYMAMSGSNREFLLFLFIIFLQFYFTINSTPIF